MSWVILGSGEKSQSVLKNGHGNFRISFFGVGNFFGGFGKCSWNFLAGLSEKIIVTKVCHRKMAPRIFVMGLGCCQENFRGLPGSALKFFRWRFSYEVRFGRLRFLVRLDYFVHAF